MSTSTATVTVKDIELFADDLDPAQAAAIYQEHSCLVIRGLLKAYASQIVDDCERAAKTAISLLDQAKKVPEGWTTPDGTLFLPAPPGFKRDKQIMVLGCHYTNSSAFFRSAFEPKLLDVIGQILGPDVELFLNGQCLYKEPVGGHPKLLHQDAGYFEHKYEGPVGVLNYLVPTDVKRGALHVVPGSHRMGVLKHVDTFSHLGLDPKQWTFDKAVAIEGEPGDSIFFHVKTIHGSPENHSDAPRPVFIHRYRAANDYIVIRGTSVANRELSEKQAAEAKKENQEGFMVLGTRLYDARRHAPNESVPPKQA